MAVESTKITVLGSTGSIGTRTLDVISRNFERYQIIALTANQNVSKMSEQCQAIRPLYAVMRDPDAAGQLSDRLRALQVDTTVLSGLEGLTQVASLPEVDVVVAGIVGAAGLLPTMTAAEQGKRILLANKESLVMTGDLLLSKVKSAGALLLPVDSEHNALFQCMPQNEGGATLSGVEKLLLTASGGPFRGWTHERLKKVTPEQAISHPNWEMGKKISVDSATLMNKGLEVIEACFLFAIDVDRIDVVVHPESIIHSMVTYRDGSVLAQLGNPDMRTPIAHALAWPDRIESGVAPLNLFEIKQLNFEKPDLQSFPCLQLAIDAVKAGGTATAVLNAANEVAVDEFLSGNISFDRIAETIAYCLERITVHTAKSVQVVLEADGMSRSLAREFIMTKKVS